MLRPTLASLFLSILVFQSAFSATITHRYTFNPPQAVDNSGYVSLEIEGCGVAGTPGSPALPAYGVRMLLPPGEAIVDVNVRVSDPVSIGEGYSIDPIQEPYPISYDGPFQPTPPASDIYTSDQLYPSSLAGETGAGYFRGYSIGYFALYPAQYRPVSGEVLYYLEITVDITTAPSSAAAAAHSRNFRNMTIDRIRIERKVDNPEAAGMYGEPLDNTEDEIYPYLLITTSSLAPSFEPLVDFKTRYGYPVEVLTVTYVLSTYTGRDNQDKIRNCILDYYQHSGTSYVLLGADDEYIRHRGMYGRVGQEIDNDIAADIYYAALDGNWDYNQNGIYGEVGEEDYWAEVDLGRAAVDSPTETANFVNKQITYQSAPVIGEVQTALMVGEDLGWAIWGSDLKEQIRVGSTYNPPIPGNFTVNTLYDTPTFSWSASAHLLPYISQGTHLINHMGHSDVTYMMKLSNGGVSTSSITNNGVNHGHNIIYSQGCYCGSFDNRRASGNPGGSDCISEQFTTISTGAVAMITNSRYGWGDYYSLNGPSQYYDRQFFDAIFGENITQIGAANQDSKEDNIPFIQMATRWVYYQLNLFGDPTLDIWTSLPLAMTPNYNPSIFYGAQSYTVEVPGVADAYCALSNENGLLAYAFTNSSGVATFNFNPPLSIVDTLNLGITAHNYLPYSGEVVVITPNMPYLLLRGVAVNDTVLGDGDGMLDLGEESYLSVEFHNAGLVGATGVYATLTTSDENLTVIEDSAWVGDIAAENSVTIAEAFRVSASSEIEDGYEADITIEMRDSQDSTWLREVTLEMSAPVAVIWSVDVFDGNDNRLEPGETADLSVSLGNTGSGEVRGATALITCDNPYLTLNSATGAVALVAAGQTGALQPMFNLTISDQCPIGEVIPMYLEMSDSMGYYRELILEIWVGGFFENFESGTSDWIHDVVTQGFADEWNLTTARNYSPGGSYSWHFGSPGGSYSNLADGGLITPQMNLGEEVYLQFYHWMDAETSAVSQGEAYDGAIVEMSHNGSPFFQIFPEDMYQFYIRTGSVPGPFRNNMPCFSGRHDWQLAVFDLSNFPPAPVQFRFRFGSDGANTGEGWYIDEVELVYELTVQPPGNFAASINGSLVHLTWNSPGVGGGDNLLHYNIYRDGELIASEIMTLEYYDDLSGMRFGDYSYQVSAVFSQRESDLTAPQVVTYDGTLVESRAGIIPEEHFLDRNYPNPFNPETSFRFGLARGGETSFAVYNVAGREVARLVNGFVPAGTYTLKWNAANLPSGVYFYVLNTEGFKAQGKMLLLK